VAPIAVVGLGKLGSVFATCMAAAGHHVRGIDTNPDIIKALKAGKAPVAEPGLGDLLASLRSTERLVVGKSYYAALENTEAAFIVVPTPSDETGRFSDRFVEAAVAEVHACTHQNYLIVVCSTVQPGTMGRLAAAWPDRQIAYAPQFIALGSVISDLRHPDLVVIGSESRRAAARVESLLDPLWRDGDAHRAYPYVARLSLADAEIAKLAVNAYVTMKISFANTIAEACEATPGANAKRVLQAVGADRRVGRHYLQAGGPYGGPCFPRDTVAIGRWFAECGVPADLARATEDVNNRQATRIAEMLKPYDRVAVLGLTYKPGTPITEGSLGLAVARRLQSDGTTVFWHDPLADVNNARLLTAEETIARADAVLVATAHPEYRLLDCQGKPTVDVWGILSPDAPNVRTIGRWVLA